MNIINNLVLIPIITVILSSCGYVVHASGFSHSDEQLHVIQFGTSLTEIYPVHERADVPKVEIESPSCDGHNYTILFGPSFLALIPNPLWPYDYYHYYNKKASIHLYITAPPTLLDWNAVSVKLTLADNLLVPADVTDILDGTLQRRLYAYETGITCGQLDGRKIAIVIYGAPVPISSTVTYKHRWFLHMEP